MTLLERWDSDDGIFACNGNEIRRAIAIAQAVEESKDGFHDQHAWIMRRADELLEGK